MNVSRNEDEKVFVRGEQVDLIIFHTKKYKSSFDITLFILGDEHYALGVMN